MSEPFFFESIQSYYSREMGENLLKVFVSLKGLIRKDDLKVYKLWSVRWEKHLSVNGRRRLNIDPGYVDRHQLVLASSKARGGRIFLGEGVFAEIEYLYVHGAFRPLFWTYADYRDKKVKEFFHTVRKDYLRELKFAQDGYYLITDFSSEELLHEKVHAL